MLDLPVAKALWDVTPSRVGKDLGLVKWVQE